MTPVYHATVLSNFARGFDKYARAYDKSRIRESKHPRETYVLFERELAIGVRKARALCDRLAIAGDVPIALASSIDERELEPNTRTGLGRVVRGTRLPLDGVRELDGDSLGPAISLEDAMARSLALHERAFVPFRELRPRSVSFLPIARGCQAACAFCFSTASVSSVQAHGAFELETASRWLDDAAARGAERAVITGGGEPTLLRWPQLLALVRACRERFAKVVLITNGLVLAREPSRAAELADAGLGVLAISRHHHDEARNAELMKLATGTPAVVDAAARAGLRVRLVCVLQRAGIGDVDAVDAYVRWASALGADEVCFKELYVSTSRESVYHSSAANEHSARNQVPLANVLAWAARTGFAETMQLPWGAPVFDGRIGGRRLRVAAYTEPSLFWERVHGIARSWNVMADGTCLASLEDRQSAL
ncbi:MAG TPA: radical SAM protein [Kofleriaceae bacterium]